MGTVVGIYLADSAGGAMRAVPAAEFVAGRGIVGDRYFTGSGTFSPTPQQPSHEVTLIELECVDTFNRDSACGLQPETFRRNVVTCGVSLNDLVGKRFAVGPVMLQGIRLCEPCAHLARTTHRKVLSRLVHRAGLRAAIVVSGTARVGDTVHTGVEAAEIAEVTVRTAPTS